MVLVPYVVYVIYLIKSILGSWDYRGDVCNLLSSSLMESLLVIPVDNLDGRCPRIFEVVTPPPLIPSGKNSHH